MSGGGKGECEKTRKVAQIRILPQNDSSLYAVIEEERRRCGEDEAVPKFKRAWEGEGGRTEGLARAGGKGRAETGGFEKWKAVGSDLVGGRKACRWWPLCPVAAAKGQGAKLGELGRAVRERKGEGYTCSRYFWPQMRCREPANLGSAVTCL